MMIIDTHSQLWTKEAIESFPKHMAESYQQMFKDIGMPSIEDTLKDMDDAGVDKAVIVAIDAETIHNYRVSNDLVSETVKKHPDRLIGFASVDPNKGKAAVTEFEQAIQNLGLRGLKLLPHMVDLDINDKKIYPLYEAAQSLGVPVLFHTGTQFHAGTKIRYCRPLFVDDVAVDFPSLKLIIAHFGYPWWEEALAVVRRNPFVYFNIAGWAPRYIPTGVIQAANSYLARKVLFGSDYPLVSRVRIIKELRELDLREETFTLLTETNPKTLLGL
jgi:predicted TIM-barrel fold metal-dependent hydrolase